ncbi:hypothetical protein CBR_g56708 [Chara braunii]|uniref:Uncharacterized protein n=1 Tax=Chara braunii TaxID=69332 RepID=A0A388MDN2_CHABU|nr:hypothetical protein CBR_g56708 [Chara braunii]|eukprot:GBG92678.1 hypothetical protein CBR_g56708 [Chara braunii]
MFGPCTITASWLERYKDLYAAASDHKYFHLIKTGVVRKEEFEVWLMQHYLFTRMFARFVASLLSKTPKGPEFGEGHGDGIEMEMVLGSIMAMDTEVKFLKVKAEEWELDWSPSSLKSHPSNHKYCITQMANTPNSGTSSEMSTSCNADPLPVCPAQGQNESVADYILRVQTYTAALTLAKERQDAAEADKQRLGAEAAARAQQQAEAAQLATDQLNADSAELLISQQDQWTAVLNGMRYVPVAGAEPTPVQQERQNLADILLNTMRAVIWNSTMGELHSRSTQQLQNNLNRNVKTLAAAVKVADSQLKQMDARIATLEARPSQAAPGCTTDTTKQLNGRIDHVVNLIGDLGAFTGPDTISSTVAAIKTDITKLQTRPDAATKNYKMPQFTISKFDDYNKTDALTWWQGFLTEASCRTVPAKDMLKALYLQLIGGVQAWMNHLAATKQCTIAELHTHITWKEFEQLWFTRFMVRNVVKAAMNEVYTCSQGSMPTRDWTIKWQKIVTTPSFDLSYQRSEFFSRSCAGWRSALGNEYDYTSFQAILDRANLVIQTDDNAANEKQSQPHYVAKQGYQRPAHNNAVIFDETDDLHAAAASSSDGGTVAALPPKRPKRVRKNKATDATTSTGTGQQPWTAYKITKEIYDLCQRHSSSSSGSKGRNRSRRRRSRTPRDRRHKSRSPSSWRRRAESESPRRFSRPLWEQRRNAFPPPGNRAWFTADLKEEIFKLRQEMDKVLKTLEQLTRKTGENQPPPPNKEDIAKKTELNLDPLKSFIDEALKPAETNQGGQNQAGPSAASQKNIEAEDKVERMVSEVQKEVNNLKLLKYDLAAVKGALQKTNEPTRTCTPIVSSSVHPNGYTETTAGLPTSVHGSRSVPSRSMPSRSAPSRSRLGRVIPPHPKRGRTRMARNVTATKSKAKRSINFGVEPMTDTQLLRLHYTDLKVLCKMHDTRYKDKPQAISALRQVPGLIAYKGRDFNRHSDLETQIMPDPDNIRVSNTTGGDTSDDEYESLSTRSSGSDDYDSSGTSSGTEDLLGSVCTFEVPHSSLEQRGLVPLTQIKEKEENAGHLSGEDSDSENEEKGREDEISEEGQVQLKKKGRKRKIKQLSSPHKEVVLINDKDSPMKEAQVESIQPEHGSSDGEVKVGEQTEDLQVEEEKVSMAVGDETEIVSSDPLQKAFGPEPMDVDSSTGDFEMEDASPQPQPDISEDQKIKQLAEWVLHNLKKRFGEATMEFWDNSYVQLVNILTSSHNLKIVLQQGLPEGILWSKASLRILNIVTSLFQPPSSPKEGEPTEEESASMGEGGKKEGGGKEEVGEGEQNQINVIATRGTLLEEGKEVRVEDLGTEEGYEENGMANIAPSQEESSLSQEVLRKEKKVQDPESPTTPCDLVEFCQRWGDEALLDFCNFLQTLVEIPLATSPPEVVEEAESVFTELLKHQKCFMDIAVDIMEDMRSPEKEREWHERLVLEQRERQLELAGHDCYRQHGPNQTEQRDEEEDSSRPKDSETTTSGYAAAEVLAREAAPHHDN